MAFKFKAKQHLSRLFLCSFLCFPLFCIPVWPWLTLFTLSLTSPSLGSSTWSSEKREKAFWKCGASGGNWECLGKRGKNILEMRNWWKLEISRETEKKHSENAELAEETGDVWENRRKHSGNVKPVEGKLGMSGKRKIYILRMRNWWKLGISRITEKKHSGNAELVEETRGNVGGNCGCLENQRTSILRHPQFPPPALHFQNAFSLLFWISPVFTSSAFPEYFFLFSQTSPVSPPLAPHSQNVFSCFPRVPCFLCQLRISRMLFLSLQAQQGVTPENTKKNECFVLLYQCFYWI